MLIFDAPYVSDRLAAYAAAAKIPVLANAFSRNMARDYDLALLDDDAFLEGIAAGKRLLTVSENALEWVYGHVKDARMLEGIRLMKDKHALRRALQPLYPDYFFLQVPAKNLSELEISALPMPFILKPSVGFYSIGVYIVTSEQDWKLALEDIHANLNTWTSIYPEKVVGKNNFLIESLISGEEYALDAYFNESGEPVILNILKHDFSSEKDVKDRLYYTSKEVIEKHLDKFTQFLRTINSILKVRNFPAHIEVRVAEDGSVIPIECNPMRFCGWGTSDIADFAFGLNTCDSYLNNRVPQWTALLSGKENQIFSFVILDKPRIAAEDGMTFDYQALNASFTKVLHLRRMQKPEYPMFGFVFAQTPADNMAELDKIMRSDLTEYLRKRTR